MIWHVLHASIAWFKRVISHTPPVTTVRALNNKPCITLINNMLKRDYMVLNQSIPLDFQQRLMQFLIFTLISWPPSIFSFFLFTAFLCSKSRRGIARCLCLSFIFNPKDLSYTQVVLAKSVEEYHKFKKMKRNFHRMKS